MNSEEMVRDNYLRHSGAKKGNMTMLALNDQSQSPPSARDTLADLLAIISDPKSVKARLGRPYIAALQECQSHEASVHSRCRIFAAE